MSSIHQLYQHFLDHPVICTDTRTIAKGCLFFALKGDKFNANAFAARAIELGAAYAIIDEPVYKTSDRFILVTDVLTALQDLAGHHRQQLTIPVIGLTGSNGKTTTKELIHAVLATGFKTFATKGNLNNHIGVPLSILSINKDIEIAVIEMGANHQQEIALLCSIAQPTHGLITNIGMAHLDGFGGFEGVKKGKAELYTWLKTHNGITFINSSNPILAEMREATGLTQTIGYSNADDLISGKLLSADPFLKMNWTENGTEHQIGLNITGAYNFENALAAICIGRFFKLSAHDINKGIENYMPVNNRSQITVTANNTVICDFYNANPSSMLAAIANLAAQEKAHKVAVLGDMFELGAEGAAQHYLIKEKALAAGFDLVIFIGDHFLAAKLDGDNALFFKTRDLAQVYLEQNTIKNCTVLLKGSRGMALEQLMPLF